ncbi:hypothetical protein Zmor_025154 [Zophobas morio]|uniref:Selenoprotein M n=1 Tax=Zophobas morio TaxID=2755281 RepID=A0AA38HW66_9CUCU|nr:hypothetical protein Zmor_025154 [Zophobas morio]
MVWVNAADRIVRVRLESCPGCKLNRLSEVKAFVYEDFPNYENAEFKKIHGASPVLLFLNEADEIVEKHSLEHLSRQKCNELLTERGFTTRKNKEL